MIPVYIRGSNCTFLSGFGKSVSSDLKAGKPKPTGNIIAHQNQLLLASTYQRLGLSLALSARTKGRLCVERAACHAGGARGGQAPGRGAPPLPPQ